MKEIWVMLFCQCSYTLKTMLITGSVYDLALISPYFQTDRPQRLLLIHFTVCTAATCAAISEKNVTIVIR